MYLNQSFWGIKMTVIFATGFSLVFTHRTITFQITFVPPISPLLSQPEATPESWFCDENTVDAEACGVVNIRNL